MLDEVAVDAAENVPALQLRQAVAANAFDHVPELQEVQIEEEPRAGDQRPIVHEIQVEAATAPSIEDQVPALHNEQEADPADDHVPALQTKHDLDTARDQVPAMH